MKLTIIIPVFNEVKTVQAVLASVRSCGLRDFEIVLVDDASTDGTRELLEGELRSQVDTIVFHEKNLGKGAAIRSGIRAAGGDLVVFQDADLEYDPADLVRMLKVAESDQADIVYGSRFLHPNIKNISPFWHRTVNKVLTQFSNFFTGLRLTDMETCYKMFPREMIQDIEITEDRFGLEPEITAKMSAKNLRFMEIPISYDRRTFEEGKKIGAKDGLRALYVIFKYGLQDL